jgi:ABC-2 type transport system ATP-binding protein
MEALIEVKSLSKRFGSVRAVNNVSFSVARGEVLGFLGPNGAGKSTTMKIITGYLPPSAGTAVVCGHDIQSDPFAVHQRIGYLPEGAPLYGDMTPEAFLGFVATVRGLDGARKKKRLDEVIKRIGLGEVLFRRIDSLSKGFKRRVGLAQAIIHDPEVLILDEPTDGLDPNQKRLVRDLIREMAPNKAIVISTHILEEVDAVCDRVVIIDQGKVVNDGTPAQLHARASDHNAVIMVLSGDEAKRAIKALREIDDVRSATSTPRADATSEVMVTPREGRFIADKVAAALRQMAIAPREIRTEQGRLDTVFHDITTRH